MRNKHLFWHSIVIQDMNEYNKKKLCLFSFGSRRGMFSYNLNKKQTTIATKFEHFGFETKNDKCKKINKNSTVFKRENCHAKIVKQKKKLDK